MQGTGEIITAERQQLKLGLPGIWTPTGWIAPSSLSFEDWEAIGPMLQTMEGAVHWWIGDWLNHGECKWGEMYAQAMDETGFAYSTLTQDAWVAGQVKSCNRLQNLSWSHHREVAPLDSDEQDYWLHLAEENKWNRNELRRQIQWRRLEQAPELPEGKYRVIYADPPWRYGNKGLDNYGHAERHYPTMSIEELCNMGPQIAKMTADDAVLFLWVTSPLLAECFPVIEAWGFEYKTSFVWDKIKHNFGHYNSVRHELLLICTRGSCTPDIEKLFDSVQAIERTDRHSEKPERFREIIDILYTHGRRIELFARANIDGWETWGNEPGQHAAS